MDETRKDDLLRSYSDISSMSIRFKDRMDLSEADIVVYKTRISELSKLIQDQESFYTRRFADLLAKAAKELKKGSLAQARGYCDLALSVVYDIIKRPPKQAGVVTIPHKDLDPEVWTLTKEGYRLKPELRKAFYRLVKGFFASRGMELESFLKGFYLVGSEATFQYSDVADIDLTLLVNPQEMADAAGDSNNYHSPDDFLIEISKALYQRTGGMVIGGHVVSVFLRADLGEDRYDAIFDLLKNVWVKTPPKFEAWFDPESKFRQAWRRAESWASKVDTEVGAFLRHTRDITEIARDLQSYEPEVRIYLEEKAKSKLLQVEDEAAALWRDYKDLHTLRKKEFDAIDFKLEASKFLYSLSWAPNSLLWKILEKWQYLALLHAFGAPAEKVEEGGVLTPEDLELVKKEVSRFVNSGLDLDV